MTFLMIFRICTTMTTAAALIGIFAFNDYRLFAFHVGFCLGGVIIYLIEKPR